MTEKRLNGAYHTSVQPLFQSMIDLQRPVDVGFELSEVKDVLPLYGYSSIAVAWRKISVSSPSFVCPIRFSSMVISI